MQVGQSDPAFMAKHGSQPVTDFHPAFPYQKDVLNERAKAGDTEVLENMRLGKEWMVEVNNGIYRTWEDLKFIRDNWDGPLILKGIQRFKDAELCIKHGVDGIIVSNHGQLHQVDLPFRNHPLKTKFQYFRWKAG
jgi:lactate 2-monooxygenase